MSWSEGREMFMKGIKLLFACLGIFVFICSGFVFFIDKFGYELKLSYTDVEKNMPDDSGTYKLVEMRSDDGRYASLSVVQTADESGNEMDHQVVYTVKEIPFDTREPLVYTWLEGTKDFCVNMSFGCYRYEFQNGTWIVFERQEDFSFAPLMEP